MLPTIVAQRKLSILYMVLEDFRGLSMSALCSEASSGGRPCASTPRLDALAKEGVVFERAYAQSPICNPSRTSFLTGRYPSATGVLSNEDSYDKAAAMPNLPHLLCRHAEGRIVTTSPYSKVFHVPAGDAPSAHQTWDRSWWNATNWKAVPGEIAEKLAKGGPPPKRVVRGPGYGHVKEDVYYHMSYRRSIAMLSALISQPTPFFFAFGISGTHVPLAPPMRFVDRQLARIDELRLPQPHAPHGPLLARKDGFQRYELTPTQQREYIATYLAAVEYVDEQVGAVLDLLSSNTAKARQTAVVVHSDHGFHLGEHGRWSKYTLYEEAVRVPLIVRLPGGVQGGRRAELVELVDVMPTLLTLWGVPLVDQPRRLDGRSLVPLLSAASGAAMSFHQRPHVRSAMRHPMRISSSARGSPRAIRGGGGGVDGGGGAATPPSMQWVCGEQHYLRSPTHSFTAYLHAATPVNMSLFDLESDPLEQNNLNGQEPAAWPYKTLRAWARFTAADRELWPHEGVAGRDEAARAAAEICGEYDHGSSVPSRPSGSGRGGEKQAKRSRRRRHRNLQQNQKPRRLKVNTEL